MKRLDCKIVEHGLIKSEPVSNSHKTWETSFFNQTKNLIISDFNKVLLSWLLTSVEVLRFFAKIKQS